MTAAATVTGVKWALPVVFVAVSGLAAPIGARPPLTDPVSLNIGISCQWQQKCMKAQNKAMKRALKFVNKTAVPAWRLQTCNRNAGRQRVRVDWVGFENCIRNPALIPARMAKPTSRKPGKGSRKPRPLTEAAQQSPPRAGPGERG